MSKIIPDPVRDSFLGPCQTINSDGSICNLPESLHDGRELDSKGYLHRFNKPINPDKENEDNNNFEDDSGFNSIINTNINPDIKNLINDLKKFIDNQIIKMSQNGAKFPIEFVNTALDLSNRLSVYNVNSKNDETETIKTDDTSHSLNKKLEILRTKYPRKIR